MRVGDIYRHNDFKTMGYSGNGAYVLEVHDVSDGNAIIEIYQKTPTFEGSRDGRLTYNAYEVKRLLNDNWYTVIHNIDIGDLSI